MKNIYARIFDSAVKAGVSCVGRVYACELLAPGARGSDNKTIKQHSWPFVCLFGKHCFLALTVFPILLSLSLSPSNIFICRESISYLSAFSHSFPIPNIAICRRLMKLEEIEPRTERKFFPFFLLSLSLPSFFLQQFLPSKAKSRSFHD